MRSSTQHSTVSITYDKSGPTQFCIYDTLLKPSQISSPAVFPAPAALHSMPMFFKPGDIRFSQGVVRPDDRFLRNAPSPPELMERLSHTPNLCLPNESNTVSLCGHPGSGPYTASRVEHSAPSDRGYGSTSHLRLESSVMQALNHPRSNAEARVIASDGKSAMYSSAESIQGSELIRYVTEFAEELSGMLPTSLPSAELQRLASTLPHLLKAFAIKLSFCDNSEISRNLMYLVHYHRQ
jgi:hypothetical protein